MNSMKSCYLSIKEYKKRYPMTIAWRLKSHAKVIDKHLNSGEKILYVFPGQKSDNPFSMCNTYIFVFTYIIDSWYRNRYIYRFICKLYTMSSEKTSLL